MVMVDGAPTPVNLHVTTNITVLAETPLATTRIDAGAGGIAVYVDGASCQVRGFEITSELERFGCVQAGPGTVESTTQTGGIGVRCDNGSVVVANCTIHDHMSGVELWLAAGIVESCEVYDSPNGVFASGAPLVEVRNCCFFDCGYAVFAESSGLEVRGNEFKRTGAACTAIGMYLCNATIEGNTIESMVVEGISCGASTAAIDSNVIRDCPAGIVMTLADSVSVTGNLFLGNNYSTIINASPECVVEGNTFAEGGTAILLQSGATNPAIQRNIIYNNVTGIACAFGPSPTIRCNNVVGAVLPYDGDCANQTGTNGNFSMEPQFCAPANGDFTLQPDSPCAPGNHPDGTACGLIGAFSVSCTNVSTEESSWGQLKAKYRGEPGRR
jgi:hypothetical protein